MPDASKKKARPAGSIGLDVVRRWFEKAQREKPQHWMEDIVEVLRKPPPKVTYTGEKPTPKETEQLLLREWVLKNFSEV